MFTQVTSKALYLSFCFTSEFAQHVQRFLSAAITRWKSTDLFFLS